MAAKKTAAQTAALARLCGITMEYQDNFGVRRCITRAAMEALLTAMGVPCGTAAEVRDSLEQMRLGHTDRLLPPMTVATPGRGRQVLVNLWHPHPEAPSHADLEAELTGEDGEKRQWVLSPEHISLKKARPGGGGYQLTLALRLPVDLAEGYYDLALRFKGAGGEKTGGTYLAVCPGQAYLPPCLSRGRRLWGLNLPLYALRSSRNWGMGDFADLRAATAWAGELGAAFVGVNPLHAPQPGLKADPSPYSPTSRLFLNFLYIDPESVPEIEDSPEAQALLARPEFQAALSRLRKSPLVAYPAGRRLKRQVLELLFVAFAQTHGLPEAPRTARGQEFARFAAESGPSLEKFSLYQALADHQKKGDWRGWPKHLQRPDTPATVAFAREHGRDLAFHQYVQWLAADQRQAVWQEASRAGLPFTLYQDLALGAAPGGFETWGYPGLFARGAAMGAPPDAFNQKGQDWGLPPLNPRNLQDAGYRLFLDTLRANLPPDGIIRMDHVMGLFRLFWIPEGLSPQDGAYVSYPARDLLGLLTLESQRQRTLVIGEDLGTVAPHIRRDLARARIFSYRVFYFERKFGNHFAAPEDYPRRALACVTTHDLPTLAGYWEGRDLDLKKELDLYPSPQAADQDAASRSQDRLHLAEALGQRGLLPPGYTPPATGCPEEIRRGVLAYLGQSQAALVETRLEEFLGITAQQNLPGTFDEHPNWRQKIPSSLEDMRSNPEVSRLAKTLRQARKKRK